MALPADTARVSAAEVPVADSIRLYAELVCDSASYLVMENRGSRPVTTDAGYRFEQRVHGRWKSVPVRGRDTGRIVLGAGERDTLRLNFRREFADVSGTRARFDRMCEAETRSRIIDWKRVDLIPDTIRPDGRFVEMTAEVEGASVLVTVRNRTGREIVFGDESDFRLGVFRDGRWMSISYARVVSMRSDGCRTRCRTGFTVSSRDATGLRKSSFSNRISDGNTWPLPSSCSIVGSVATRQANRRSSSSADKSFRLRSRFLRKHGNRGPSSPCMAGISVSNGH